MKAKCHSVLCRSIIFLKSSSQSSISWSSDTNRPLNLGLLSATHFLDSYWTFESKFLQRFFSRYLCTHHFLSSWEYFPIWRGSWSYSAIDSIAWCVDSSWWSLWAIKVWREMIKSLLELMIDSRSKILFDMRSSIGDFTRSLSFSYFYPLLCCCCVSKISLVRCTCFPIQKSSKYTAWGSFNIENENSSLKDSWRSIAKEEF